MKGTLPMADVFMGRTDNIDVRYAAGIGLLFNVFMVIVAMVAIIITVPKVTSKSVSKYHEP